MNFEHRTSNIECWIGNLNKQKGVLNRNSKSIPRGLWTTPIYQGLGLASESELEQSSLWSKIPSGLLRGSSIFVFIRCSMLSVSRHGGIGRSSLM
jgi:hypothetical protein